MSNKRLHVVSIRMLVHAEDDNVAMTIVEDMVDEHEPKRMGQYGPIEPFTDQPIWAWTFIEEPEELHAGIEHTYPVGPIDLVNHPNHK